MTDADACRLRADADRLLVSTARRTGWWLALLGGAAVTGAVAQVLLPAATGHVLALGLIDPWRIQARAAAQGMIIVPVLQVIVLAVAGVRLAQHRITAGELVAASQYAVLAVGFGASIGQVNQLGREHLGGAWEAGARERSPFGPMCRFSNGGK